MASSSSSSQPAKRARTSETSTETVSKPRIVQIPDDMFPIIIERCGQHASVMEELSPIPVCMLFMRTDKPKTFYDLLLRLGTTEALAMTREGPAYTNLSKVLSTIEPERFYLRAWHPDEAEARKTLHAEFNKKLVQQVEAKISFDSERLARMVSLRDKSKAALETGADLIPTV